MVRTTGKRLRDNDVAAIFESVKSGFLNAMEQFTQQQKNALEGRGLKSTTMMNSMVQSWNLSINKSIETLGLEIQCTAREWERERVQEKKRARKELLDSIPAWWGVIGPFGSFIAGWIVRGL